MQFSSRMGWLRPALLLVTAPVFGAVINISTGVASWTGTGPNVGGSVPGVNMGATPNSVWVPAPSGSQWISTLGTDGALSTTSGVPGTYVFLLSFATPGLGGSLSYQVAADNQGSVEVLLDGVLINAFSHPGNSLTDAGSSAPGCAFLPAGSSLCLPAGTAQGTVGPGTVAWGAGGTGTITLRATVINSVPPDPSPVGFLLAGQAEFSEVDPPDPDPTPMPEPSTYAMAGFGLALLLARRLRK